MPILHHRFTFWRVWQQKRNGTRLCLVREEPVGIQVDQLPIQKLLLQARWWEQLLNRGLFIRAELAEKYECSRPRVTQILGLLRLSLQVQELLLSLDPLTTGDYGITEKALRPVLTSPPKEQMLFVIQAIQKAEKGATLRRQRARRGLKSGRSNLSFMT